jgi:hypothetical protein
MPELDYLLNDNIPCPHYPYTRTFDEAEFHPCIILQRLGSSELPRPVIWTHRSFTATHSRLRLRSSDCPDRRPILGRAPSGLPRTLCALPVSEGTAIPSIIRKACFNRTAVVLGPAGPCTADVFNGVLDHGKINSADCLTETLEEVARRPDILAKLRRLQHVTYVQGNGQCGLLLQALMLIPARWNL